MDCLERIPQSRPIDPIHDPQTYQNYSECHEVIRDGIEEIYGSQRTRGRDVYHAAGAAKGVVDLDPD